MHITVAEVAIVMVVALATIFRCAMIVCSAASSTCKTDSIISQLLSMALAVLAGCALGLAAIILLSGADIGLAVGISSVGGLTLIVAGGAGISAARQAAMGKRKIKRWRYRELRPTQFTAVAASAVFGAALVGLAFASLY